MIVGKENKLSFIIDQVLTCTCRSYYENKTYEAHFVRIHYQTMIVNYMYVFGINSGEKSEWIFLFVKQKLKDMYIHVNNMYLDNWRHEVNVHVMCRGYTKMYVSALTNIHEGAVQLLPHFLFCCWLS